MNLIFDFIVDPYSSYSTKDIFLEGVAVIMGLSSVWFAKQDKVWVYPTGMISTSIYVYILLKAGLIGDLLINAYYFIMSIYGWIFWTQQKEGIVLHQIDTMSSSEKKSSFYFLLLSIVFVGILYMFFGKWDSWSAPIDLSLIHI